MEILTFEKVSKIYNKYYALKDFTWSVEAGEIHALLGHNGAGKTTSFLIANNLIPFNSGKVTLQSKNIKKIDFKEIGFLTEKLKLYDDLTVKETLSFFCDIFAIKNKPLRISYLIDKFGLENFLDKDIKNLSTGMYKKVSIAITVINDPSIIFLDEPFSGLDPIIVREISNTLKSFCNDDNKTIILSSHDLFEVEAISDNITIMKEGQKVISGSLNNLYQKYKLKNSFNIFYLKGNKEVYDKVENEYDLFNKLKEINENKYHITEISENKIKLSDVYNQIYRETN